MVFFERIAPSRSAWCRRVSNAVLVVSLALATGACDGLLEVEDPDVAGEEALDDPAALNAVVAGAISDFQVAYTGSSQAEGMVLASGMLADEYEKSGTFSARMEFDQRRIQLDNVELERIYRPLHRARTSAERAAQVIAGAGTTGNEPRHALLLALAGYAYVLFGENYCSGVPFSTFPIGGGKLEYGVPLPTSEIIQRAIDRFDEARSIAAPGSQELHLALVGKGRALLNQNKPTEAAAAVAPVPTSFSYALEHSANSPVQHNGVWHWVNNVKRWRVADREGGNGLPYRSDDDPRVRTFRDGVGFDQATPQYSQLKYVAPDAAIPVADGIEARLIEAESALRSGVAGIPTFLDKLNELRAQQQMPPLTDPGSDRGRQDLLFKERAYWLWQTAHRLGDLRRLVRQYGRDPEEVFPTGTYFKGGAYGGDVNFPVPFEELNNPEFQGCLSRDA